MEFIFALQAFACLWKDKAKATIAKLFKFPYFHILILIYIRLGMVLNVGKTAARKNLVEL